MKSVTEFPQFKLEQGLKAKNDLSTAGKTNEEIATSLGETFKYEGDKLKHFIAAIDVASQNAENLARVLVVSLNEGESVPPKAVQVETFHYVPEFKMAPKAISTAPAKEDAKGGRGAKKGGKDQNRGPKPSPWGISPEEKAAKKAASAKAQREAKAGASAK